jgi:para-nitrobenzyl esterase
MNRVMLIATAAFALSTAFAAINDPVRLDTGLVTGSPASTPEVRVFKGIPFAAPPVGDRRWREPKPIARWEGVRKADEFSPVCMQDRGSRDSQKMSEDCLYLNVWTGAQSARDKRPVMVWIYGGGYYRGSGSLPMYDGEALARKGVVVVTFNYRLGPFGFFSYPELTKESDRRGAGNFGVMDALAALQWVQRNIAAFGGDSKRVTIFGESAGAGMIANLMTVPQAKGLFQRAIGESSAWATTRIARLSTLAEAEQAGTKFAASLGAYSLADLRAKPAEALRTDGRDTAPVVDGWLIPDDPSRTFAAGKQIAVPVLVGSNRDESFGNTRGADSFIERVRNRFGDLADAFLQLYTASSAEAAFAAGRDEMAFVMRNWAQLASASGKAKSYVYYFTQQPPPAPNARGPLTQGPRGTAIHTAEILYVFNHLDDRRAWTDADRHVADAMSSYWVNFAANGDPNAKGLPKWMAYDGKTAGVMVFGNRPEDGQAPSEQQLAFFQSYFEKLNAK